MQYNIGKVHEFTSKIIEILKTDFGNDALEVFSSSPLLIYINTKTKSANSGAKSRGSFANHYALYVVIEDYINNGYYLKGKNEGKYDKYDGAIFSSLFKRQRELPFGKKLQNHALNSRLNEEFRKYNPTLDCMPIIRNLDTQRYWIHEDLIKFEIKNDSGDRVTVNIAKTIIKIIDAYVATKKEAFEKFIEACHKIEKLSASDPAAAIAFVDEQLKPNVDARVFEIVSFAVLKAKYGKQTIWIGDTRDSVYEESLILYKTGRTNANDGGIDFVMRPLGRFFQVTETIDVNKYFLDIDKVQRFPMTFVVKTDDIESTIKEEIRKQAKTKYKIDSIVESYMSAIEQIINTKDLAEYFKMLVDSNDIGEVMNEIIIQSKLEFNYLDEPDSEISESETDE